MVQNKNRRKEGKNAVGKHTKEAEWKETGEQKCNQKGLSRMVKSQTQAEDEKDSGRYFKLPNMGSVQYFYVSIDLKM